MKKFLFIVSIVLSFQSAYAGHPTPRERFHEAQDSDSSASSSSLIVETPPGDIDQDPSSSASGDACKQDYMDASFQEKLKLNADRLRETGAKFEQENTTKKAVIGALFYAAAKVLEAYGTQGAGFVATQFEAYAVADFITGFFHWFEDTYFSKETPMIGEIIAANRLHHDLPRELLKNTTYQRIRDSMVAATIVATALYMVVDSDQVLFTTSMSFWGALANEIHAWSHMLPNEKPWIARVLQGYFFQTSAEHHLHHVLPTDVNYCVMSPWLNWILDYSGFWRGLEWAVESVTGVPPRVDEMKRQEEQRKRREANSPNKQRPVSWILRFP